MSLVNIYEEYNIASKEYLNLVNNLADNNLEDFNDKTLNKLESYKCKFEKIMEKASEEIVLEKDEVNLKDLKYLVLDNLFLASDLKYFYELKEVERFKMRLANYVNKKRRAEFGV